MQSLHSCWAYDVLVCMSEMVCYKSAEGELAVRESEAELRSRVCWQKTLPATSASTKHVGLSQYHGQFLYL